MIKIASLRSGGKLGLLDYVLTAIGSALAVYSGGMSVDKPSIGLFCGGLILIGTLFSYLVRTVYGSSKMVGIDGFLYAGAALATVIFSPALSGMLPDGGFAPSMGSAGSLCWMLVLGSFLSWRDSTLLFQAIPGIALFGLVGCYDTYAYVVFAFYAFLICLCTRFARAHGREMLRRAAESGYFDRAGIKFDVNAPEQSAELYDAVRAGAWRWVAGPEWALLSALAIVFVSLLGAPVIQSSVQGVAGFAKISNPSFRRPTSSAVVQGPDPSGQALIGQGPITTMTGDPVLEAKMDHLRYLRLHAFTRYTGNGWKTRPDADRAGAEKIATMAVDQMSDPVEVPFEVNSRVPTRSLALPSEVEISTLSDTRLQMSPDGGFQSQSTIDVGQNITGNLVETQHPETARSAVREVPSLLSDCVGDDGLSSDVAQLADSVARNQPDDRAKADAIMQTIADHAQYNANSSATPAHLDAVSYFLFTSHQGYCDLFASSMVLMARHVGIPARYATGYLPDATNSIDGIFVARDRDYHAWAELFFKGAGWVVYDPTSIAQIAPGGQIITRSHDDLMHDVWLPMALQGGAFILVVGAIGLLAASRIQFKRRPKEPRSEIEQTYVSFARELRRATGRRRLLNETPSEYVIQTRPMLNGSYEAAEKLTRAFEVALYAPHQATEETVATLQADLRKFKKLVREKKSPEAEKESSKSL